MSPNFETGPWPSGSHTVLSGNGPTVNSQEQGFSTAQEQANHVCSTWSNWLRLQLVQNRVCQILHKEPFLLANIVCTVIDVLVFAHVCFLSIALYPLPMRDKEEVAPQKDTLCSKALWKKPIVCYFYCFTYMSTYIFTQNAIILVREHRCLNVSVCASYIILHRSLYYSQGKNFDYEDQSCGC